jgi:Ca-activated chloride channel family protein
MKFPESVKIIALIVVLFLQPQNPLFAQQRESVAQKDQSSNSPIRLTTDLVLLNVMVTDRNGQALLDLKKEGFKVYEDGVEQMISFFGAEETPVSWGLVLDRSSSMKKMMAEVYQAALHVLDEGTDDDEAFIATFNNGVEKIVEFTSDRNTLRNSLIGLRATGNTALYDAVAFALKQMRRARHQKKVLVVVTDGEDNSSRMRLGDLVELAQESDVLIYAVGMFDSMNAAMPVPRYEGLNRTQDFDAQSLNPNRKGMPMLREDYFREYLKELAEVTGATAHFPSNPTACKEVMRTIALEVSRQYSLGYYPTNMNRDGKWRKTKVVVAPQGKKASGYVVRTRAGYYAPKEAK